MNSKLFFLVAISLIGTAFIASAQDYSEDGQEYFIKYLDKKSQIDLISKSLPSVEDCKLVFKGNSAYTYYGFIADMKAELNSIDESNDLFVDCRIETFTTCDILQGKGNYAGGMSSIVDELQPTVVFYAVTYLREKDAEYGSTYKYFVNIRGNWVFFPKPYLISK